jgi:hypothetical protein
VTKGLIVGDVVWLDTKTHIIPRKGFVVVTRGTGYVEIPKTWLRVISNDSMHGKFIQT